MRYTLKPYNIWEQGCRDKQEDSLFPAFGKSDEKDRLFIVCDGMGGHSAGEIASKTVCTALSQSVLSRCKDAEGKFSDEIFKHALNDAYDELDKHDDGAEKKMGTTLTFLKLHDEGATIAHIGDSRVYHIRPGKTPENTEILFQTTDHSLINNLIKIGELTPEEAKYSNQKNVITRVMQPNLEHRYKADIHHIDDIKPGDYFMLCSDGIVEQLEDDNIKFIFSDKGGSAENKTKILTQVTKHNRDNHTAIIVHIINVIKTVGVNTKTNPKHQIIKDDIDTDDNSDKVKKTNNNYRWFVLLIILLLAFIGFKVYNNMSIKRDRGQECFKQDKNIKIKELTLWNKQTTQI